MGIYAVYLPLLVGLVTYVSMPCTNMYVKLLDDFESETRGTVVLHNDLSMAEPCIVASEARSGNECVVSRLYYALN